MLMKARFFPLLASLVILPAFAATDNDATIQGTSIANIPTAGNFALPGPQQPGPLLSFGQTLIGKNQFQVAFDNFSPYSLGGAFDNVNAEFIYGLTDDNAIYFNYPLRNNPQTRTHHVTMLKDVTVQMEQSVYSFGNSIFQEQATFVGAISLPTQDAEAKALGLGFGQPSYFFGTTYNRTDVNWMYFASPGYLLTTQGDGVQLGSQLLYQAGLGRALLAVPNQSILFGLLELNGQYTEKNSLNGIANPNTGGNVITLSPSLWLSSPWFAVQVGVGFPVLQHLNGNQTNMHYFIASNCSWTIT